MSTDLPPLSSDFAVRPAVPAGSAELTRRLFFSGVLVVLAALGVLAWWFLAWPPLMLLPSLLALGFAALLIFGVAYRFSRGVQELTEAAQHLSVGNLNVQIPVFYDDELGKLARNLNEAALQLRLQVQSSNRVLERSQQIENNIEAFLDVAMDIAEGDFTRRGQVSEDVLGNVVDAINLMVEEISSLLKDVQDKAVSVRGGAAEMIGTTSSIVASTEAQTLRAQEARLEVLEVTRLVRETAQNADSSAMAARRALAASKEGEAAVTATLTGMEGVRGVVQTISGRIKSLGERSLEVVKIVETISSIASQTNLLALNAATEAVGAGDAGSRFAVVADEVRRLAEDSAVASRHIAVLVRNMQSEVQEVAVSVEGGTREVETGYRVAGEAGERLREIAQIVTQSAGLAERISGATQQQVVRVEGVLGAVTAIAGVTETTSAHVLQGREAAEALQRLAEELTANLSRFRLSQ